VPENQDDDNNPEFIIGGTELDQTVWETSRRFLVTLTTTLADGSVFHSCTASLISRRVVLSAAREFVDYIFHYDVNLFHSCSRSSLTRFSLPCSWFVFVALFTRLFYY